MEHVVIAQHCEAEGGHLVGRNGKPSRHTERGREAGRGGGVRSKKKNGLESERDRGALAGHTRCRPEVLRFWPGGYVC